jgi:hypothetical protein
VFLCRVNVSEQVYDHMTYAQNSVLGSEAISNGLPHLYLQVRDAIMSALCFNETLPATSAGGTTCTCHWLAVIAMGGEDSSDDRWGLDCSILHRIAMLRTLQPTAQAYQADVLHAS